MPEQSEHIAIVVMGVCGVGKSSVAQTLADGLGAQYIEADDFHTAENRSAMARGIPLSDEMRYPWLARLARAAETARGQGSVVMACSALKRAYRDVLRTDIGRVQIIFLKGDRDLIARRLRDRKDHFVTASLLDSQLAILEPPDPDEHALVVDVAGSKDEVRRIVADKLHERLFRNDTKINPSIDNEEKFNVDQS